MSLEEKLAFFEEYAKHLEAKNKELCTELYAVKMNCQEVTKQRDWAMLKLAKYENCSRR